MLIAGLFSIVILPFAIAFDFIPPALIPLEIPLGITAILGTTGPVSFLVLGPSRAETSETCGRLVGSFGFLRAGAAVDPMALGAVLDHELGPSGNLWMSEGGGSWMHKVAEMIEDAPLVIFDARVITKHTRWEFFHLMTSVHLSKVILVGPVGDPSLARFLEEFDGLPVVDLSSLTGVVKAACTRSKLLKWYDRRQHSICLALQRLQTQRAYVESSMRNESFASGLYLDQFETWDYVNRFYDRLPDVISIYDSFRDGRANA
jgi:hypothetical protein